MKIKRIHISNYRAFLIYDDEEATGRYVINLPAGENLLVYGENGSGKSSLFKALKEFLISAGSAGQVFHKNLFYDENQNSEQPFIDITFDDDTQHRFSADGNQYFIVNDATGTDTDKRNDIAQANIVKGFISYRDLLKLHFRHNGQEPDLFAFFLGEDGLFADTNVSTPLNPANRTSFGALWKKVQEQHDNGALADYNTNVLGLFQDLEKKANLLLNYFHKDYAVKINYDDAVINAGEVTHPVISLSVTLFGKEISQHGDILNEARLTSLAVSVYLAYILSLPPAALKVLFLDDIFIGLDMSNRIPLVKMLTAHDLGDGTSFGDFQIFVTTYDREWFNIAKNYLGTGWQKVEFYVDNHKQTVERPLIRKSETFRERAFFHLTQGDYPACANYLRKAFEHALRNILPENALYVAGGDNAVADSSLVMVSRNHFSIKETDEMWLFMPKTATGNNVSPLRHASLHTLIDQFKSLINQYKIPFPYTEELAGIKNRLLNPLSHDDLRSPVFKTELETGFTILDELLLVKSKILIDVSTDDPSFLFFDKTDNEGKDYSYKFQLLENLRYVEYNGFGKISQSECKPVSRTLKSDNTEEQGPAKNQKSIYDLCKGICILSAAVEDKKSIVLEEATLPELVYTADGKYLKDLI